MELILREGTLIELRTDKSINAVFDKRHLKFDEFR